MSDYYIIVKIGRRGPNRELHYQIYERCRDFNHEWYELSTYAPNSPMTLGKARELLEELMEDLPEKIARESILLTAEGKRHERKPFEEFKELQRKVLDWHNEGYVHEGFSAEAAREGAGDRDEGEDD